MAAVIEDQKCITVTIVINQQTLNVRGRLAFVLVYLAMHEAELSLDQADNGRLQVDFGSGNVKASVTHFMPGIREPV